MKLTKLHRSQVDSGTSLIFNQSNSIGRIVVRKLTTPEAVQFWSRHSSPGWNDPDAITEPICTVVLGNAVDYLVDGPIYYVELDNKPLVMAQPQTETYFDYGSQSYYGAKPWVKRLLQNLRQST